MKPETLKVIQRLEAMPKQGERYEGGSDMARRNPIRGDTGWLLYSLVLAAKPFHILEIGTAYGLSTCYLGAALPNSGATIHTIEFDPEVAKQAQTNLDEAKVRAKVWAGDALQVIPDMKGKVIAKFGVVFLDADKSSYLRYLGALKDADLLMPNALILADNVIDRAHEVKDFMNFVKVLPHTVLQTECGLLVAQMQ